MVHYFKNILHSILLVNLLVFSQIAYAEEHHSKTVISFASSTIALLSPQLKKVLEQEQVEYINASIGGQIIETITAHQGSNPISIRFVYPIIYGSSYENPIHIYQSTKPTHLKAKGIFQVTLSNGLKGQIDLTKKTFSTKMIYKSFNFLEKLNVDFGYSPYRQHAIHIFNIGKNNISPKKYTTQEIFDSVENMVEFIESVGNHQFIVVGYFSNTGMSEERKKMVVELNERLKKKYGEKFLDVQEILMSKEIWNKIEKVPTEQDLKYQLKHELAPSLSRDRNHVSSDVNQIIIEKIINKLKKLNYI